MRARPGPERGPVSVRPQRTALLPALLLALVLTALPPVQAKAPRADAPGGASTASALPAEVRHALSAAHVATRSTAFVVLPLDGGTLRVRENDAALLHPASTMKLLTTWVGLEALGPQFQWHTRAWATGPVRDGVLSGDLVLQGGGDPSLVIERWWLLLAQLRTLGLREIQGDLVVDRGLYGFEDSAATLDGDALKPYNVAPDALLVNYRAVRVRFAPDEAAGVARVLPLPAPPTLRLPATVPLSAGPCGDWHARLAADFTQTSAPQLRGRYPTACGTQDWQLVLLDPDSYLEGVFREAWTAAGGTLRGHLRRASLPAGATLLTELDSPPLSQIVRDINKFSNNVMARQLFLALGGCEGAVPACREGKDSAPPSAPMPAPAAPPEVDAAGETAAPSAPGGAADAAGAGVAPTEASAENFSEGVGESATSAPTSPGALSPARSARFVHAWLARAGLPMPGLTLENGSGLSRHESIRAADLAALLARAWSGPEMPDLLASLPHAGVDGTMHARLADGPQAWIKTGMLSDVRAAAGYVFAASGRRYVVVALVNGPGAAQARPAIDGFLKWVWKKG